MNLDYPPVVSDDGTCVGVISIFNETSERAEAARLSRPSLELLFITGYAENAVLNHGHLDQGMHVMTKPFQMDAFAREVKELIGR
ncbi:hypothetical protein ATO67_21655 [Agrobacterium bohemicum]|uniref:Response regulatory domain-containing protein n=1 Tax=Agrobacterium bohemicum TaxID=2052828 RepID=A0A135P6D6_9HYPH|nr:hypothetical protein ATO67_21655 [Agrobacterium bohemicum]